MRNVREGDHYVYLFKNLAGGKVYRAPQNLPILINSNICAAPDADQELRAGDWVIPVLANGRDQLANLLRPGKISRDQGSSKGVMVHQIWWWNDKLAKITFADGCYVINDSCRIEPEVFEDRFGCRPDMGETETEPWRSKCTTLSTPTVRYDEPSTWWTPDDVRKLCGVYRHPVRERMSYHVMPWHFSRYGNREEFIKTNPHELLIEPIPQQCVPGQMPKNIQRPRDPTITAAVQRYPRGSVLPVGYPADDRGIIERPQEADKKGWFGDFPEQCSSHRVAAIYRQHVTEWD